MRTACLMQELEKSISKWHPKTNNLLENINNMLFYYINTSEIPSEIHAKTSYLHSTHENNMHVFI